MNVLVVEDTKMLNTLITKTLESINERVFSAFTGEEALNILDQVKVDIILMDYYMPDTTAAELLKNIRAKASTVETPVIILSANSQEETEIPEDTKVVDYLQKPLFPEELKTEFQRICSEHFKTGASLTAEEDFIKELRIEYCEDWNGKMPRILEAFDTDKIGYVRQELHTLAGSGTSVGLPQVTETAREAQAYIREEDFAGAREKLVNLKNIFNEEVSKK